MHVPAAGLQRDNGTPTFASRYATSSLREAVGAEHPADGRILLAGVEGAT
jgi:hypothetical protein